MDIQEMSSSVQALTIDTSCSSSAPRLLLYSSCVAKPLQHYLSNQFKNRIAVDILLVHALEQDGITSLETYSHVIKKADFIAANVYSPKFGDLGLHKIGEFKKDTSTLITWTPPNFAAFWPVVEGFGEEGVIKMMNDGKSKHEIAKSILNGTFDPMFEFRFNDQVQRLRRIESNCTIKTADFVAKHHKTKKLWFTVNHPTYNVVAWMGDQIAEQLGLRNASEETALSFSGDETGTWNVFPETHYEFDYYRFTYPMKHKSTVHFGGIEYYSQLAIKICDRITERGS